MPLPSSVRRLGAASILPLLALAAACEGDVSGTVAEDRPVALAAGGDYTCVLTGGGAAYCWGSNDRGQLGDGSATASAGPVRVDAPERLVDISASHRQTCAVGTSGSLYCWGAVAHGAEPVTMVRTPDRVIAATGWARASAGLSHACALTRDGEAFCWGSDQAGQLGDGARQDGAPVPVAVAGGTRFTSIHAAALHSCGLAVGGAAYCWGYAPFGVVGSGAAGIEPVPVAAAGALRFTSLDTGATWACGVSAGDVYCWGVNNAGELGRAPLSDAAARQPAAVAGLPEVAQVFASRQNSVVGHNCALTGSGEAFCWGENAEGEAGVEPGAAPSQACASGSVQTFCTTQPVHAAPGLRFGTLALGRQHTCGITRDHEVYCWGRPDEGQLGPSPAAGGATPTRVELPES